MNIQSTGGYESTINGKAERPHRTLKDMMRCHLIGAAFDDDDELWCLSYQYCIILLRCRWNRIINSVPLLEWDPTKKIVEIDSMHIFGSKAYRVTDSEHKKQLETRTFKDPRHYVVPTVNKNVLPDHIDGYFVGYGSYDGRVITPRTFPNALPSL